MLGLRTLSASCRGRSISMSRYPKSRAALFQSQLYQVEPTYEEGLRKAGCWQRNLDLKNEVEECRPWEDNVGKKQRSKNNMEALEARLNRLVLLGCSKCSRCFLRSPPPPPKKKKKKLRATIRREAHKGECRSQRALLLDIPGLGGNFLTYLGTLFT